MRVMVLTSRRRPAPQLAERIRARAELPPEVDLELVTVHPYEPLPGFSRIDAVDRSLGRPRRLVPISVNGSVAPGPSRMARGLRAVSRVLDRLPVSSSRGSSPQRLLEMACAASGELQARARRADAVVAYDQDACLGAWRLGQRVESTPIVYRPRNLRTVLKALGRPLPSKPPLDGLPHTRPADPPPLPALSDRHADTRLLIAPANYAGQGHAWATAVTRHLPSTAAVNLRVGVLKNQFPADCTISSGVFAEDLRWRLAWRDYVHATFSHVLIEANLPIFGVNQGGPQRCIVELQRRGAQVALVSHGSDARIPSVHAQRERWHSYDALDEATLQRLERNARANTELYNSFEGPVFVSTLGLKEFVPGATWLPVVVDPEAWHSDHPLLERRVPVVAHAPSTRQKGSHMIDPLLTRLAERGLIEYRRVEGVPYSEMPEVYGTADIVVEQFGIADYSAAACEAMAAGRVVVSRVADKVRTGVLEATGLALPVVEANPETLEDVILDLLRDPDRVRELAERGRAFVRSVHDGRRSAQALSGWLGADPSMAVSSS